MKSLEDIQIITNFLLKGLTLQGFTEALGKDFTNQQAHELALQKRIERVTTPSGVEYVLLDGRIVLDRVVYQGSLYTVGEIKELVNDHIPHACTGNLSRKL